jgi:hypothetical protein
MSIIVNIGKRLTASGIWQQQRSIAAVSSRFFKSDLSLDKLYPNSKQNIFTPSPASEIIVKN